MKKMKAKKHWFKLGETNWHLLVEANDRVFHRTIIIYDTRGNYQSVLATNKKLKEFDVIEMVRKLYGWDLELEEK
jgi:hypothetical protein